MTVKTKPSFIRVLRNAALAVLAVIAVFAVLFVSAAPLVERSTRPTAADIAAARKVWKNLAATESDGDPVQVWLDNTALEGLAALASDATGAGKFDARVTEGELTARASFALPAGLWLNASVAVSGDHSGFPDYTPRVGRVTFPQFAGRWGAEFGRWMLHQGGVETPPVDEVFRRVNVGEDAVMVQPRCAAAERTGRRPFRAGAGRVRTRRRYADGGRQPGGFRGACAAGGGRAGRAAGP